MTRNCYGGDDEESRTAAVAANRQEAKRELERGFHNKSHPIPRSFPSQSPDDLAFADPLDSAVYQLFDQAGSFGSTEYQNSPTAAAHPHAIMERKRAGKPEIRTSFQNGGHQQVNRVASGPQSQVSAHYKPAQEVHMVSDDSELEDESEGGIMLNVGGPKSAQATRYSDMSQSEEDGEVSSSDSSQNPSMWLDGHVDGANSSILGYGVGTTQGRRILADLSADDLEKQIKYVFYHLQRDQIDLSRPAVCLSCHGEGHLDSVCPATFCANCGDQTKHQSRICPKLGTCARCGEIGHRDRSCPSKVRNPDIEPCRICHSAGHVDVSCVERFFCARSAIAPAEVKFWITCAQCGSNDHFAGDCSWSQARHAAPEWSVRGFQNSKIVNISLQSGTKNREREVLNRGLRPEGLEIRSRTNRYPMAPNTYPDDDDDDDFTSRLARNAPRRRSPPRGPSPHRNYRNRSRSPPGRRGSDHSYPHRPQASGYRERSDYISARSDDPHRTWSRSPSPQLDPKNPSGPNSWEGRDRAKKRKRDRVGAAGGQRRAGVPVVPMPSAGKQAWKKGRS